jgi:RNA polymerase sigma-70 factor, ECF subfamily
MDETTLSMDEAVRILFELYADEIYRFAYYMLNDAGDAKDAVQEVFVRVVRAWEQYRHDASDRTWLWRIARNHVIDVLRRRKKVNIRYYGDVPDTNHVAPPDGAQLEFDDLIRPLPPRQRQVVVLRFVHDMSIRDIASLLEWPATRVRNTLHRAIKSLRNDKLLNLGESGGMAHDWE